jgi:RNA polymerase sigma factor (sigma-70 family)
MRNETSDMPWKEAFARLSEPHWDALLRFAVSLCHSQERGEDLVQTALLRGVRFFRKFCEKNFGVVDPEELPLVFQDAARARHLKNWLYKILKNVYLDDQASLNKWTFDSDEEAWDRRADESGRFAMPFEHESDFERESPADPKAIAQQEKEFFHVAADDALKKELDTLSDRQRSVLYLIAEDYSYKEVASILNIPIGTVMSTLSRGLSKLRSKLTRRTGATAKVPAEDFAPKGIESRETEVWNSEGADAPARTPAAPRVRKVAKP